MRGFDFADFTSADTGRGICYRWPTDPSETVYSDLLFQPLLDIAKAHPLLLPPSGIHYSGFPTPRNNGLSPWDLLSGEFDRGDPLAQVLLSISFSLGHEQGRRTEVEELRDALKVLIQCARRTGRDSERAAADSVARRVGLENR